MKGGIQNCIFKLYQSHAKKQMIIKMCRKTPSLQGWGYKARPPNLRK